MSGALLSYPKFKGESSTGIALSGGLLYTYDSGTTTPKVTYSDADLSTPNTNPVALDVEGEAVVWLNGEYKLILKDSDGVTQWTMDDVVGATGVAPSNFALTLLDDASASAMLTTLGFSTFAKTLIDVADAVARKDSLGLGIADNLQILGLNNGTYDIDLPTNGMAAAKFMLGDSNTITWFYVNTAPPGWKVLSTGADTVLAVSGGSQAYSGDGGTAGGTWTQPDCTLTTDQIPAHTHLTYSRSQVRTIFGLNLTIPYTAGSGESSSSTGGGSAHSHGTTYRPSASIGKLFQLDTA